MSGITKETARRVLGESMGIRLTDFANEYGEPGYSTTADTIWFGDLWCQCDKGSRFHTAEDCHPRVFAACNVEMAFDDEWWTDYETGKAWRTEPDSYSWKSSILWSESLCGFLTPDHDIEDWLAECVGNPRTALPRGIYPRSAFESLGWTEHQCGFENGWHHGQTDDPIQIAKALGDSVEFFFELSEVSQFYVGFCVWTRLKDSQ